MSTTSSRNNSTTSAKTTTTTTATTTPTKSSTSASATRSTSASTTGSSTSTTSAILSNATTKWDPTTDFYNFLNYGLFADNGDCYGFSSTSILYYMHYDIGDQTAPYFPQPTTSLSQLPGQTGADTLTQVTFPIYIHQHFDPNNLLVSSPNEASNIATLMSSIKSGSPVMLLMGPSEGHAIVAWGYVEYANGTVRINVSDPNFGNVGRIAYYYMGQGQFSYTGAAGAGSYTWTTFSVASPGILQWGWLQLSGVQMSGENWSTVVDQTNPYYTYVFSDAPITIGSSGEEADFSAAGDTQSFNSTIPGAVGFEEGSMQVYGIPEGVIYSVGDPGQNASSIVVVVPQNETSIVGYDLTSVSSVPLNVTIKPTSSGVTVTTAENINLAVGVFSIGSHGRAVQNNDEVYVSAQQSAVLSVPDWNGLNNSQSAAADVQVFQPNSTTPVATYTLARGSASLTIQNSPIPTSIVVVAAVVVVAVIGTAAFYIGRRRGSAHNKQHQQPPPQPEPSADDGTA